MAEDMDTDTTPPAQDEAVASSIDDEEDLGEDLRRLAPVVIAFVAAVAFVELARWGVRRLERRLAMRHPMLTELAEERQGAGSRGAPLDGSAAAGRKPVLRVSGGGPRRSREPPRADDPTREFTVRPR